jgi:hypothetical protein
MSRAPRRSPLVIVAAVLAVALAGCTNPAADRLLLADAPPQDSTDPQALQGLAIWAVQPGEEPDEANRVTSSATSPLEIASLDEHGLPWINNFGREWQRSVLVGFGSQDGSVVRTLVPGDQPTDLARSPQLRTTVLRRGALVATQAGCTLATTPADAEQVGEGSCAISSDERWVVSWQRGGDGLTVRDLRNGRVRTIDDVAVDNAAVLSKQARILVTTTEADRVRAILFDARDGSEVARTELYPILEISNLTAAAEAFVLQTRDDAEVEMLHVDVDGEVRTIDRGPFLVPITNAGKVTYLRFAQDLADSSLRRWSPDDDEPKVLLEGYVGAAAVDQEHVLAVRETDDAVEFHREQHGTGELRLALSLPLGDDPSPLDGQSLGVSIPRVWVKGHTAYLQVDRTSGSSFVRIDLTGDDSDAPIRGATGLRLESLDKDGTAVLTRTVGEGASRRSEIVAVRPGTDDPDVRATFASVDLALIHKGRIYFTDGSDPNRLVVRSVRASGSDRGTKELYANKQLAGASWPEHGGAITAFAITPRLLLEQRQQAVEQQQAADAARAQALEQAQQGG